MQSSKSPLVSIGIPVFNGENYLRYAITSILEQTFRDFELIISDNASTDGTCKICEEFSAKDKRIKYIRNDTNLGAGANYNNCYYHSSGKYFKWVAHDDMIDSSYLEMTVEAMEENLQAVLCFTDVTKIDERSNVISLRTLSYNGIFSLSQSDRFSSMVNYLRENECFFGLFRRKVLEQSELHGNYMNSDLVLMAEVALRGKFIKVSEPLFLNREHQERYTISVYPDRNIAGTWFDANEKSRKPYRAITLYRKYIYIIKKNVANRKERLKCYVHLLRFAIKKRNLKILLIDLIYAISPWIYYNVKAIRTEDINTR